MTELAWNWGHFDENIGHWDVSSVGSMNWIFEGSEAFNQDIGGWDVSLVTSMSGMFTRAVSFNQDIGGWDVANVGFMIDLFRDATAFNQALSGWCVARIPQKPQGFDTGATGWTLPNSRPVWGTCPAPATIGPQGPRANLSPVRPPPYPYRR